MATKKQADPEVITIKPIEWKQINLRVVGDTPLITHHWSEKAKKKMIKTQKGEGKTDPKEPRDPVADFIDSMYWISGKPAEHTKEAFYQAVQNGAKFGFKTVAFKKAGNSTAYRTGAVKNQAALRLAYFIESDYDDLTEIHAKRILMREDPVTIGMGTADLRYRGEFQNWYADLRITYNANGIYKLDDIINIVNNGGACGVGEWRPERDGQFGRYHVDTSNITVC